jgi:hypothetical protein
LRMKTEWELARKQAIVSLESRSSSQWMACAPHEAPGKPNYRLFLDEKSDGYSGSVGQAKRFGREVAGGVGDGVFAYTHNAFEPRNKRCVKTRCHAYTIGPD